MILITVGTEKYPFNRLIQWVDRVFRKHHCGTEILVQSGACTETVCGAQHVERLKPEAFEAAIARSRLIVSHCGEGSFLKLRETGKPFLLVPRRHGLGEHIDDHQWELANALVAMGAPVARMPLDVERFLLNPPQVSRVQLPGPSLIEHLLAAYPVPQKTSMAT